MPSTIFTCQGQVGKWECHVGQYNIYLPRASRNIRMSNPTRPQIILIFLEFRLYHVHGGCTAQVMACQKAERHNAKHQRSTPSHNINRQWSTLSQNINRQWSTHSHKAHNQWSTHILRQHSLTLLT